jgi:hypothetical protein
MNDFRPDWIGAIGAGIAAFIFLPIANRFVPRTRNQTMFYVVFGICIFVLSLTIRAVLRLFGI